MPPSRDRIHGPKRSLKGKQNKNDAKRHPQINFGIGGLAGLQHNLGNQGMIDLLQQREDSDSVLRKNPRRTSEDLLNGLQLGGNGNSMTPEEYAAWRLEQESIPTLKPDFYFSDGTETNNPAFQRPANVYTEASMGTSFVFPAEYDVNDQEMTPELAMALYKQVPEKLRKQGQSVIQFVDYANPRDSRWRAKYDKFSYSYATGGMKNMTFYGKKDRLPPLPNEDGSPAEESDEPQHDEEHVVHTYCHEIGHKVDLTMGAQSQVSRSSVAAAAGVPNVSSVPAEDSGNSKGMRNRSLSLQSGVDGVGGNSERMPFGGLFFLQQDERRAKALKAERTNTFFQKGDPRRFSGQSQWLYAIMDDEEVSGELSPTEYGENNPTEDFAESIGEYVTGYYTDGMFETEFPHRTEIVRKIVDE